MGKDKAYHNETNQKKAERAIMLSRYISEQTVTRDKELHFGKAPVAHTCNPSYSGGRDQVDHISKPTRGNSL
jgi:hypothetical protein